MKFQKEKGIFEFRGEWKKEIESFKSKALKEIGSSTENLDELIRECRDAGLSVLITYRIRGHQRSGKLDALSFAQFVECVLYDQGIESVGRFDDPAPALHYLREEIGGVIENIDEDEDSWDVADRVANLFDGFHMGELVLKLRRTNGVGEFFTPYNAEDMLKIAEVQYFSIELKK